jgi:hypothetical protein
LKSFLDGAERNQAPRHFFKQGKAFSVATQQSATLCNGLPRSEAQHHAAQRFAALRNGVG